VQLLGVNYILTARHLCYQKRGMSS